MFVNSTDDFINPATLGNRRARDQGREAWQVRADNGVKQTHGHGTHMSAAVWQEHLKELRSTKSE